MAGFKKIGLAALLASLPHLLLASQNRMPEPRPVAFIYRGDASCDGCSSQIAELLEHSPRNFQILYGGGAQDDDVDITEENLKNVALFVQPDGGNDHLSSDNFEDVEKLTVPIRNFVAGGGRYLGFNLGAVFAKDYGILPQSMNVSRKELPETDGTNSIVEVEWNLSHGILKNITHDVSSHRITKHGVFFDQNIEITGLVESEQAFVLGRYSSNQKIAASLTAFGAGWVGLIGLEPQMREEDAHEDSLVLPDGVQYQIGYDFVEATMYGGYEWCHLNLCKKPLGERQPLAV